jgi:hypothetical protein
LRSGNQWAGVRRPSKSTLSLGGKMRKLFGMMLLVAGSSAVALAFPAAPEIDPASAASAVALIAGGLLMINTRRKK